MMMNFLIALLSNSLANVLKDKHIIMTTQKSNAIIATEFTILTSLQTLAKIYYQRILPKYFIVKDNRVYFTTTTIENNEKAQ